MHGILILAVTCGSKIQDSRFPVVGVQCRQALWCRERVLSSI